MKLRFVVIAIFSHGLIAVIGFALGIYMLPILVAPPAPSNEQLDKLLNQAQYTAEFVPELKDSDLLHYGQGALAIGPQFIALKGRLAPGPNYQLYLSKQFVETEQDFNRLKTDMIAVGRIQTFDNFIVDIPRGIDLGQFTTVIVWCDSFNQFISSAQYQ